MAKKYITRPIEPEHLGLVSITIYNLPKRDSKKLIKKLTKEIYEKFEEEGSTFQINDDDILVRFPKDRFVANPLKCAIVEIKNYPFRKEERLEFAIFIGDVVGNCISAHQKSDNENVVIYDISERGFITSFVYDPETAH